MGEIFAFFSRIEFIRSKLSVFRAHVSGVSDDRPNWTDNRESDTTLTRFRRSLALD